METSPLTAELVLDSGVGSASPTNGSGGGDRSEAQPLSLQCQLQIVALLCNQEGIAEPRWGQLLVFLSNWHI